MRDHSKECRSAEIVLYLYNKMKSGCICWEINKGSTGIGVESMIYEFENSEKHAIQLNELDVRCAAVAYFGTQRTGFRIGKKDKRIDSVILM